MALARLVTDGPISKKYQLNEKDVLGSGAFAKVFKAKNKKTKEIVAVKRFTCANNSAKLDVESEIGALFKLNHKHIVSAKDVFVSDLYYFVVLEYIPGGHSLIDLFMDKRAKSDAKDTLKLTEKDVQIIIRQITDALYFAMTRKVCHRDVKLDNILVRDWATFDVVLADFNFSKELDRSTSVMRTKLGTPGFKAPEIVAGVAYNYKCDIWSLGVLFYALISWGQPPFLSSTPSGGGMHDYEAIFKSLPKLDLEFEPEEQFEHCSNEAKKLLKGMLTVDAKRRFTYKKIKKSKWFSNDKVPDAEFDLNQKNRSQGI